MYKELAEYETIFDKHLNKALIDKSDDEPLLEFIIEAWRSLQIIDGIEILDWTYTDKMSEIDINKYIIKRNRNVRQKEKFDFKYIEESYLGLLTVTVGLTVDVTDPKTNETVTKKQTIKKSMLIPIMDEDGCYMLNGQRVYTIYQLVEKSTYTVANSVILKSLMPFAIRRYTHETKDIQGNPYVLPVYTIELFKKDVEVMLLFATRGLNHAIQFALEASYVVMTFVDQVEDPDDLSYIYFQISSKLFLKVDRSLFERFVYVRSVVGGILTICTNRLTIDKLDDCEIWLKKLGNNNLQKGENLLRSAKRLLDETTGKILKVELYHKHDIYTLTRWACQEFNDLRMKDNMDLNNKRIRCGEIISSLLTMEFSLRLNRLMTFGKKADLNNYREVFSFPGDMIKTIIMSPLNHSNCGKLIQVGLYTHLMMCSLRSNYQLKVVTR